MTVASAQTLRKIRPVHPFEERTKHDSGFTYGLGPAGYDIRVAQDITVPPGSFVLASSLEHFDMPLDLLGVIHDKSTWARMGLVVQNTVIEPGWRGHLTLELTNHLITHPQPRIIPGGTPIAQVVFHLLDEPTTQPYPHDGKYQDQGIGPEPPRLDPVSSD